VPLAGLPFSHEQYPVVPLDGTVTVANWQMAEKEGIMMDRPASTKAMQCVDEKHLKISRALFRPTLCGTESKNYSLVQ
jgi:hypothetical protein